MIGCELKLTFINMLITMLQTSSVDLLTYLHKTHRCSFLLIILKRKTRT